MTSAIEDAYRDSLVYAYLTNENIILILQIIPEISK